MTFKVKKIDHSAELRKAHEVRYEVFVREQNVPPEAELDEFEDESHHFIAYEEGGRVIGAARWRFTDRGVKLERFAISKNIRGKGAGSQLVRAVLQDIYAHPEYEDQQLYLHSQIDACPLYLKFGFEKVGEMFEECGIQHFEMIKNPQG